MELFQTSRDDEYALVHNGEEHRVSFYEEHNSDHSAAFYCYCNYIVSYHNIEYTSISSLNGSDLVDNVALGIDGFRVKDFPEFSVGTVASKDGKLIFYYDVYHPWEEWKYEVSLRAYGELLSEKLIQLENVTYADTFIEDSCQFVTFNIEVDLDRTIDDCFKETKLLIMKLHNEVIDSLSQNIIEPAIIRSIEFEPEYFRAGLDILSYFSTIVRDKYPDGSAKVSITQNGHSVVMTMENNSGEKETIEKLLQDYELVLIGEKAPETFFDTQLQILDLRSELRIAQARLEDKAEQIAYKTQENLNLQNLLKHALSSNSSPVINMDLSPVISIEMQQSTKIDITGSISEIYSYLERIISNCDDNMIKTYLTDVNSTVQKISNLTDKNRTKESSGLVKIKALIEDANKTGSSLNTFLGSISNGFEAMQKIAKKYNTIAEWCGAPQVPSQLLK